MSEFKNRINVTINDQHYTIVGEDSPEHIRDTTRKSVLTAVNIMHEKVLLEEENRRLQEEVNQFRRREL